MQKLLKEYLDDLNKRQKRKRKAMIAAMLLVVMVVGSVLGGLTQYGVAMTGREKCGLEEHEHGEACYTRTLTCGKEESEAHTHTEECLSKKSVQEAAEQTEEESESRGHAHTDDCYGEPELVCGLEETKGHSHTDDCYTESEPERVLTCELEEMEGHSHSSDCYSESEPELTCGEEEGEEHSHGDDCYSESEPELICGEEETEGHSHGDGCYSESEPERELTCKEEEAEGHTHTDGCYVAELICGKEEGEAKVHTDAGTGEDVPAAEEWVCGLEEGETHTHTEDCYTEELTCEEEEHIHTEACYIDREADVESREQWDQQYADTEWQELWGEDLVAAARVQLGYTESTDNYETDEDGNHKGYTRYGHFADAEDWYMDWDAAFVNYCLHYAGPADSGFFPDETDTAEWAEAFCEIREENRQYLAEPEGYVPQPGDLVWLKREDQETEQQMGIVSAYDEETAEIQVIQGNSEDEVRENTYDTADEDVTGYLKLSELEKEYKNLANGTVLTEEEQAQVDAVIALIEALPDLQEVWEKFTTLQEAEDEEGYDAYYQELYTQVLEAKNAYDALTEAQKQAVTNAEKLLQYEWLWTDMMDGQNSVWDVMGPDEAYVNTIEITKTATGAAPFDEQEGDGNDTTADDRIVRTFDTVTYSFNINMKSWDSSKSYSQARVKLEFVLPLTESEAVFDQTAMAWMDQTEGYQPKLTIETRSIDGEEIKCQVLTCYKLLLPSSGNQSVVPGDFGENVTVNVRSMKNGQKFAPILSAAMEGGTWEGTCEKEDHKINGQPATEKKTVTADKVKVTAAPKYNIQVGGDSTYKDDFDFSVADAYKDIAANTHITDLLPGRMMKLGITLQLYNDNASKGLKGIELPEGEITFDLEMSSRYTINQPAEGSNYSQNQVITTTTEYRPLLWSCDGNRWVNYGEWNQDGRVIYDSLSCAPFAPYNKGGWRTDCWNGGQWAASQDGETGTIHITVSGYEINPDHMPVINGDNAAGFYGANVGCFSAGQIWIVQPFNTMTDGKHGEDPYFDVVNTYGQGAFATTAVARNLQATTVGGKKVVQGQDGFQQVVTNDDELTRTLELVLPGSVQNRVRYASVSDPAGKGAGVDDSRDGRDYAAVGSELYLMGGFSYNARREDGNQLYLGTNLMKFYGSAIKPMEGDWKLSLTGGASLKGNSEAGARNHVRVMYATKEDGTDWKDDDELKGTYEYNLKFYDSLSEIPEGHVCVGILTSFIGPGAPVDAADPYYLCYYRAKVKDDMKLSGNTYMLASTSRVWTKEILSKNNLSLDNIPDWTMQNAYKDNLRWIECSHLKSANVNGSTWYNKETYKPDGSGIYGTHNSDWGHWGDTLLIIGYKTRIEKNLMQKDGNGQDKKTFNLDADQRVADFRLQPGTYYDQPGTFENTATVTIVDTLPRYMSYKPGSAYFGGAYEQSSSYGGTKGNIIKDETPGAAFPDPKLTEPTSVTHNPDGTQTLTWVINDVKIGDPMAPIYYSVDIGSKGNPDEDVPVGTTNLENTAYITTPYDMRDPMKTGEKHAEAGIAVTRGSASSFGKYTKQKVADEDGQIDYVVYFNNNAESTALVTIMDTMPADQINGSHFTGTYTFSEWKIDTSKCDIDKIKIYYTFDEKYQDKTTKEVSREEIEEKDGSWHQTEIGTDGKIKIPAFVTDQTGSEDAVQEHPVAWAVTGTLESGKSVYIDLKLQLDPGVSAQDKTENNYFVNRLSSGDTTITTETPTVRRTLEGLNWMDHNRDGVQNEESGDRISGIKVTLLKLKEGGNPEEETGYVAVCYPGTSTPISIRTGQQISIRAAEGTEAAEYGAGRYRFTDLPAGTFAVKFESADGYCIADLKATGKDCGDNDYMDSDAEAFYSENGTVLDKTVIFGIRMPEAEEMSVSLYESKFHDSGFYTGVPLTIQKTDENGNPLSGASFTMSDESGRMLSFVEEDGAYRAVTEEDIVSSAYVYIAFASNERYVMGFDGTGNGASAQIQLKNDSQAQQFQMYTYDDGSVGFQHRASGRWLDLDGGNTGTDAKIQLWDGTGNPSSNQNHKWILDPCKDYYMIHSANGSNDSYIDLDCGITEEGHKIHTWSRGDSTQRWKLIPVKTVGEPNGTLTVNADGSLQIKDLMPGEYSLTEIASPEGYTLLRDPVKIEVKKDGTVSVKSGEGAVSGDSGSAIVSVKNVKLYELPEAGGIGTYWYTISGTLLMIAGMLVLYRKNMRGRC